MLSNLSREELEDFSKLLQRIFSDYRDPARGPFTAVYVFSHTPDNEDSLLRVVIEMEKKAAMKELILDAGEGRSGWLGFDHTMARLQELGWKNTVPIKTINAEGQLNTRSEADALAQHAQMLKGDVGIIAPSFHLARAFVTAVTAWKGVATAPIFAIPGLPLPWNEEALHSQGILRDTRANLLHAELERLEKYRAPEFGSLFSFKEALEYLDRRP